MIWNVCILMTRFLGSVRITVACLFLLFILTFWGTIAQVQQGLYAAQDRFFILSFSWPEDVFLFPARN